MNRIILPPVPTTFLQYAHDMHSIIILHRRETTSNAKCTDSYVEIYDKTYLVVAAGAGVEAPPPFLP
jgi:hypothetical protein